MPPEGQRCYSCRYCEPDYVQIHGKRTCNRLGVTLLSAYLTQIGHPFEFEGDHIKVLGDDVCPAWEPKEGEEYKRL